MADIASTTPTNTSTDNIVDDAEEEESKVLMTATPYTPTPLTHHALFYQNRRSS